MVSYPRSGSNLLFQLLRKIANKHLVIERDICYSYNECGTVPCSCTPPAHITKNHDFNNDIPIDKNITYIVVIRKNPIFNIEAYLRMMKYKDVKYQILDGHKIYITLEVGDITPDFIIKNYKYYTSFYNKWISNKHKNIHVIYKEDIIENPTKVINILFDSLHIDNDVKEIESYTKDLISLTLFKEETKDEIYFKIKDIIDNYKETLKLIENKFKLQRKNIPEDSDNYIIIETHFRGGGGSRKYKPVFYEVPAEYIDIINNNLDTKTEMLLGYNNFPEDQQ